MVVDGFPSNNKQSLQPHSAPHTVTDPPPKMGRVMGRGMGGGGAAKEAG